MTHQSRLLCCTLALSVALSVARGECVTAWPSGTFANNTWGPSYINSNPVFAFEREVADDFDFSGRITRVLVSGYNGGPTGSPTPIDGVWVRFYEWTPSGPGVLQAAIFVAGGDPHLGVEPRPSAVEVELPVPFVASGLHFMSVQLDFTDYGSWDPWQCNFNSPRLSTGWVRNNNSSGTPWSLYTPLFQPTLYADVDFVLYTDVGTVCNDWSPVAVPTPGNDAGLVDIVALGSNDVWALGNNSTVTSGSTLNSLPFALHYDGSAWSLVNLPPAPTLGTLGSRATLEAIEAFSANDVWAAGSHNMVVPGGWVGHQIRADHYDGSNWTTMATPLPPTGGSAGYSGSRITSIKAFAANDVWFAGEWSGPYPGVAGLQPALAMHWDGSSFTLVPTPEVLPIGGNGLDAIDGVAPNDIWAVGGGGDGDLVSYSYILHWDGSNWSHVPGPLVGIMQRLSAVVAIASNDVWVAGESYTGSGLVAFLQHWNGSNWSNVSAPAASFTASFFARSATDLWLGLWHWNGTGWNLEHVAGCDPGASAGLIDGAGNRIWMVGATQLPGRVPYVIERSGSGCAPQSYCSAKQNSLGCTPAITSSGAASASASSGFSVSSANMRNNKAGVLFYSNAGRATIPFSGGTLCMQSPVRRMPGINSGGSPAPVNDCSGVFSIDVNAFRAGALGGNPAGFLSIPGSVVDCQFWGRDPGFPPPNNTQLSDALEFVVGY